MKENEMASLHNFDQQADSQSGMQMASPEEEDMDVPEIIEEILELLLTGLRDTDTVVRWSAAKGIGRVTARLTWSFAEDVLSSLLDLFLPGEGDGSWHGGCLALAELARRGLLLPVSFPKIVPLIIKALHYDVRRGPHSIGSHVRDAAAYVCWAFGRAYSSNDMKSILEQIAPHLLIVACYDREVNCRRAASAAFQENVGRQGNFPHGIDIVNTADYFSLASRNNSYLSVAVSIAQHKEYLYPFVDELLSSKINHWDKSLRELAAEALSALARYDPGHFSGYVLDKLIPSTLSLDLCSRHGATLASGELVLTLHRSGFIFPTEKQKSLAGIVPAIEKARLYRGKGGEIMRSAVSKFIECISLSKIALNEKIKKSLLDTLNENLKHPNAQIQSAAVDALRHFIPAYLVTSGDKVANEIVSKYLLFLDDPNVAARRGAALALGILPYEFLADRWKIVTAKLCRSCTIQDKPDDPDAEARVNAVHGLVSICETLTNFYFDNNFEEGYSVFLLIKNEVMETLFQALEDYAVDNRGDVGSWVREASMDGLERCTYILSKGDLIRSNKSSDTEHESDHTCLFFDEKIAKSLVGGIAKQAVEKIDKLRDIAARTLCRILYNQNIVVPSIPQRDALEHIIPSNTDLKWLDPNISYPRFVQLLQTSYYSRSVLSGLVISIGGLQESLRKASVSALEDYLHISELDKNEERKSRLTMLSADLVWVLQHYRKCERVISPTFKAIEILLSKKIFLDIEDHSLELCAEVIESLESELKGSKDFTKICAGLSILGYISSLIEPIKSRAFSQLLSFLAHRYPRIRKAAADQVYLVLLQNPDIVAEENMEKAVDVISETCWDGAIEEAKTGRAQLYELTGVHSVSISKATDIKQLSKKDKATADENNSYSSLVDFSGY